MNKIVSFALIIVSANCLADAYPGDYMNDDGGLLLVVIMVVVGLWMKKKGKL